MKILQSWRKSWHQSNATNSVKLRELMEKQENCATELEEKEERWMYLNELAEQMGL